VGIHSIGSEDGTADKIALVVTAKLIALKFVILSATGLIQCQLVYNHQRESSTNDQSTIAIRSFN
jgi:hypothetical protein